MLWGMYRYLRRITIRTIMRKNMEKMVSFAITMARQIYIYKSLGVGIGLAQTTIIVNKYWIRNIFSRALQRFIERSKVVKISRRLTKKIGNNDADFQFFSLDAYLFSSLLLSLNLWSALHENGREFFLISYMLTMIVVWARPIPTPKDL